jgi:hypothetical protein
MRRARLLAAMLASIFIVQEARSAGELELYRLQKVIMELQARAARGDVQSQERAKELFNKVAEQFDNFSKEKLSTKKNTAAAIIYLLSGGNSAPVRKALAMGKFFEPSRPLLEGALAFAEGQGNRARDKLEAFDPLAVDPVISAPLAFARGLLEMNYNHETSLRMYDIVRLVAPRSAFDEAASRRRAIIFADRKDIVRFLDLSRDYLRIFANSPYAAGFRDEMFILVKTAIRKQADIPAKKLIDLFASNQAFVTDRGFMELTREAVLAGNVGLALDLTEQVRKTVPAVGAIAEFRDIEELAHRVKFFSPRPSAREESARPYADAEALLWSSIRRAVVAVPKDLNGGEPASAPGNVTVEGWGSASPAIRNISAAARTLLEKAKKETEDQDQP